MLLKREELKELMKNKLVKAGLSEEHADQTAEILTWADERGYHSHGAVRVEYYAERIAKGGINANPKFEFRKTGPSSGVFEGDNGCGYPVSVEATKEAIKMAKESGIAVVGMRQMSHSGSIGYYTEMCAKEDLVAICFCQSDPMAVPFGGTEPYYGTNPISFAAPGSKGRNLVFDMATTVQAWGKILDKKSRNEEIPADWAVGVDGKPVTDPHKVNALLPIAGAKGYGLMMLVDVFSGILLDLPFGGHVSSMYHDLSKGRDLGQMIIVMDPNRFMDLDLFKERVGQSMDELNNMKAVEGYGQVYWPGQRANMRKEKYDQAGGIEIVDEIVDYLKSDDIHFDRYDNKNRFAE
jgi:ureidoglycolate dehydrogenase (NAD+)